MKDDFLNNFVHEKGRRFYPAKLPDDIERGRVGNCFDHCLITAMTSKGKYQYCEGKAYIDGKWYHHAWLTDAAQDTKVEFMPYAYDPTWSAETEEKNPALIPAYYLGAALDLYAVAEFVTKTEFKSPFANHKKNPELAQKVYDSAH